MRMTSNLINVSWNCTFSMQSEHHFILIQISAEWKSWKTLRTWRYFHNFETLCANLVCPKCNPQKPHRGETFKPDKMISPLQLRNLRNHKAGAPFWQHVRNHWCSQFQPSNFAVFVTGAKNDEKKLAIVPPSSLTVLFCENTDSHALFFAPKRNKEQTI